MDTRGKALIVILIVFVLTSCSMKNETEAFPNAQYVHNNNILHNSSDLQTNLIQFFRVEDFARTIDPIPILEITDPQQIAIIIDSIDFSKWETVSLEKEYSTVPDLCIKFNENMTIVMDHTIPVGYGYLCKEIGRNGASFILEDSEGPYYFNDALCETAQSYLTS